MFDDVIIGDGNANNFRGFAGDDTFDGAGGGADRADYSLDISGVFVDLGAGTATDGWGDTDTLLNIERVRGSDYNDEILGNGGNNRLEGGLGDDQISGLGGNDTLIGGDGDDLFTFADGEGNDTINDFVAGVGTDDQIDFSAVALLNNFADVQANVSQVGFDAVIDLGGGNSVTLIGVDLLNLHQDDFLF